MGADRLIDRSWQFSSWMSEYSIKESLEELQAKFNNTANSYLPGAGTSFYKSLSSTTRMTY